MKRSVAEARWAISQDGSCDAETQATACFEQTPDKAAYFATTRLPSAMATVAASTVYLGAFFMDTNHTTAALFDRGDPAAKATRSRLARLRKPEQAPLRHVIEHWLPLGGGLTSDSSDAHLQQSGWRGHRSTHT